MLTFCVPYSSNHKNNPLKKLNTYLSEFALVTGLKAAENRAFVQLYDQYCTALFGIIFKIIPHQEIAEDVLQEVFIRIWRSASDYDSKKGRLFTWLLNLTRNLAIDKTRSKSYQQLIKNVELESNISHVDEQEQVVNNTDIIGIKDLMRVLPYKQFLVLDLTFFKGYTHVEVSQMLSWPLGTVKANIRCGIKALRSLYGPNK